MSSRHTLQQALARQPDDDTAWLALADCLEEEGAAERAELVRLQLSLRRSLDAPDWPVWEERLRQLWAAGVEGCQPTWLGPHGMHFVLVPPGQFWMGASQDETWHNADEQPRHRVSVMHGFWLGRTPVTQFEWAAVLGGPPSPHAKVDRLPAGSIHWGEAQRFCTLLGEQIGRPVRLPTEAEWEYACRAGTATPFCSGVGVEALRQVGWCSYDGNWDGSGGTQAVGQFRPNSWGLYDMHGNVWEWCSDWFDPNYYQGSPGEDPAGPEDGEGRSMRGGSWRGGPWFCRSAERWSMAPEANESNVGLRVVVELA
jgi:uncharacterized protein (TIGR02996 family)